MYSVAGIQILSQVNGNSHHGDVKVIHCRQEGRLGLWWQTWTSGRYNINV